MLSDLIRRTIATASLPWSLAARLGAPGIRVLMYHRVNRCEHFDQLCVEPSRFAQQMAVLAETCEVVSLADAIGRLQASVPIPRRGRPLVAVTFDDGYLDNLIHALPVLQRHRIPATVFVTTAFCDQRINHPRYAASEGRTAERLHLNWDEVRRLASYPGITIGSHSVSHPYLSQLSDAAAFSEMADSRSAIENQLGAPVRFFCYPSGDTTQREQDMATKCGYQAAVTVAPGLNRRDTPPQALRRTEITDRDGPYDFRLKLLGGYDPVHGLLHRRRLRRFAIAAYGSANSTSSQGGR